MPLIYRGGGHLEPPTRALLSVGVVRLGVDAVIPIRRGRQRWRIGVGRVRRREPEGIPEEGINPETECGPHESEIAEEAEPMEAVEAVEAVEALEPRSVVPIEAVVSVEAVVPIEAVVSIEAVVPIEAVVSIEAVVPIAAVVSI